MKGCIFDLDGVIVDTAKYHYLAWKKIADEFGFVFTEKDNERLKGVSRMASLDILLSIGGVHLSEGEKLQVADKKNEIYLGYILKMTPDEVLPGVLTFLKTLRDQGIKISLGSASKNAKTILHQVGIENLFDAVADGTNVSKAKPDPEVFLKGAELLNLSPADCVVFEDARAGIEAAHRAGMKCVGIGDSVTLREADTVVGGFLDLSIEKGKLKIINNGEILNF
ncbi:MULTISPECIES: beta-phosphoglucomutase [Culturomica]|jgi:beta-phosphoglucomutase|uniref:beta-phosphoglucomutase n=1 Tax=Culturomica TaxID=1926651 RepID=UPI000E55B459|nr:MULTISPECIES: beta-phosphoglucomutase [Odoribacteraceae]RHV92780.1 beta-phosphoglucomutase [Odoribacter sp. OF09-27XD]HBO27691.1 beta-phosphoglucomutase [Culturomica sp.]